MTAVLDVLCTHLQQQVVGVIGSTLFLDWMPDTPDALVAVYYQPGTGPVYTMAKGKPLVQSRIQVFARGAPSQYQSARTLAYAVQAAFAQVLGTTLSGMRIVEMAATDDPVLITRDAKERCVFSQYWEVTFEP